jgi:hypothetical protein
VLAVGLVVMDFGGFSLTHVKEIKTKGAEERGYVWEN